MMTRRRLLFVCLGLLLTAPSQATFSRRKAIDIDQTQVAGAANLSDFPVLISLVDPDLAASASASGNDILFRAENDATCGGPSTSPCRLDHEIELWDSGSGTLVAWVRVPVLQTSVDTRIYLYYGDSSVSCAQESPAGVWDADFREVFHLNEVGDHADSSANGFRAVTKGNVTQAAAGKIGPAVEFHGPAESRIIASDGTHPASTSFTIEGWFYLDSLGGTFTGMVTKGRDGLSWFGLGKSSIDELVFYSPLPPGNLRGPVLLTGNWFHAAATYDAGSQTRVLYLNGTSFAFDSGATYPAISEYLRIGDDSNLDYLDGRIDEVRVSRIARSADWLQTSWQNGQSPSTFYSLGPEDLAPPPVNANCAPVEAPCEGIGAGTCHLRSIGTAAPYILGSVSATNGSPVVFGLGTAWLTANRGPGDRMTLDGSDYTVLSIESEVQLTLTSDFTGIPGAGKSYSLDRKFSSPRDWEDCIDGPGGPGCEGVSSFDLIADNRGEIGIVYDDGVAYSYPFARDEHRHHRRLHHRSDASDHSPCKLRQPPWRSERRRCRARQ